ncbi:MAG: 50S ribosomal protein L3 N(5)-glutamine methyltransferase [Nevskiales bacterium]|nr:50S ribosomal protein L3 N(5)-glutamine methyltransferase [Nevskiales bacterium]
MRDLVRWGASEFGRAGLYFGHGTDNALDEAFYLVTWALKLPHDLPAPYWDSVLTESERKTVLKLLRKRIRSRKPAAYLTGEAWFAGVPFIVDERVLVPRSPIAELIEAHFRPWLTVTPRRILDLCAGSGCIAIACAYAFPETCVDAAERDAGALEILRQNITRHELGERVEAVPSDLFDQLQGRKYELMVTNPPYVPEWRWDKMPAEYHHEPKQALTAGREGLDVVGRILEEAPGFLSPEGVLVCEVGGSASEFKQHFPDLPAVWPRFERGGDGVFVITRKDLVAWHGSGNRGRRRT